MHGSPVEVRKGPKSTTWYNAVILDVIGESVHVGFEDSVWPSREVPAYSVRRCPQDGGAAGDEGSFDPQVDEVVEVLINASEANPKGWSLGRVKTIRNSFYFIGFVGNQRGSQDLIVERGALRPCSVEPCIEPSELTRRLVSVEPELHGWLCSQDSVGCLNHVRSCGQLLVASCTSLAPEASEPPEVLLVGDAHAVDVAERLLVQIHFNHQIEMQRFHEQRAQFMERLAERQRWFAARHQEVFYVDQGLVGKLIGRKGEHIRQVRERHGVDILVQDDFAEGERHDTAITVRGTTAAAVRRAREELEYVTDRLELKPEQVEWILGRGHQNITEIARKAELHYARFDDTWGCLELCGLKHQVEDARMLIQVHSEYLSVYRNMDEEQSAIQQSFDHLDGAQRGTGPRRSTRGGGRGSLRGS